VILMMIILQFDGRYHPWALLLLRSLALHEPRQRILCDTVGLDRSQMRELEGAHRQVICRNSPRTVGLEPADMANRKPFVLRDAIDEHPDESWFCLLDADILVRRGLDDLWALVENASSALMFTNGMWEGRFYARLVTVSSVVLLRRDGRELVDRWAHWYGHGEPVDGVRPRRWFWDQVTLFLAWSDIRTPIAGIPIDRFANDALAPYASIWAANVPDKAGYFRRFQTELERQEALRDESTFDAGAPFRRNAAADSW
jgi:hypothetical protein